MQNYLSPDKIMCILCPLTKYIDYISFDQKYTCIKLSYITRVALHFSNFIVSLYFMLNVTKCFTS